MAGVGMSVMHDANHGAYSRYPWINNLMGRTIYLLGGSRFTWKIQHNILHHTYTNIYGLDEDIHDKPILRLSPHGRLGFLHRYQHVYDSSCTDWPLWAGPSTKTSNSLFVTIKLV